jgi:hypothetical protein
VDEPIKTYAYQFDVDEPIKTFSCQYYDRDGNLIRITYFYGLDGELCYKAEQSNCVTANLSNNQ